MNDTPLYRFCQPVPRGILFLRTLFPLVSRHCRFVRLPRFLAQTSLSCRYDSTRRDVTGLRSDRCLPCRQFHNTVYNAGCKAVFSVRLRNCGSDAFSVIFVYLSVENAACKRDRGISRGLKDPDIRCAPHREAHNVTASPRCAAYSTYIRCPHTCRTHRRP